MSSTNWVVQPSHDVRLRSVNFLPPSILSPPLVYARASALAHSHPRPPAAAFERRFKIHLVSVTRDGLRHGLFFARPPLGRGNSNYRPLFPHWKHIPPGSQYPRLADALCLLIYRFVLFLSLSLSLLFIFFESNKRNKFIGNYKVQVLIFTTKLPFSIHRRFKCQSD